MSFQAVEERGHEFEPGGRFAVGGSEVLDQPCGVSGDGGLAPAPAQALAEVARRRLPQGVHVSSRACVVEEVAGVEEVVLAEKG